MDRSLFDLRPTTAELAKGAREAAKAVRNERAKLSATFVNGVAVALIAVGAFSPVLSPTSAPASASAPTVQSITNLVCLVGGFALHLLGRYLLRVLR